jgi:hypothetical protein
MNRVLVSCCALIALSSPCIAQTKRAPVSYYAVINSLTHRCLVVDRMPQTDTPNVTLASDAIYQSRAEAEQALKTLRTCNQ